MSDQSANAGSEGHGWRLLEAGEKIRIGGQGLVDGAWIPVSGLVLLPEYGSIFVPMRRALPPTATGSPSGAAGSAILPCPVCRGEAKLVSRPVVSESKTAPKPLWYMCSTEGCNFGPCVGDTSELKARASWNRLVALKEEDAAAKQEDAPHD